MTLENQLYKCDICENVAEIVHHGAGKLSCCGEEMRYIDEKPSEVGNAHYAIVERDGINISVKFNHEMISQHYIEFVEIISKDEKYLKRKYFKINEPCEMKFKCDCFDGFKIKAYCNIHGAIVTEVK